MTTKLFSLTGVLWKHRVSAISLISSALSCVPPLGKRNAHRYLLLSNRSVLIGNQSERKRFAIELVMGNAVWQLCWHSPCEKESDDLPDLSLAVHSLHHMSVTGLLSHAEDLFPLLCKEPECFVLWADVYYPALKGLLDCIFPAIIFFSLVRNVTWYNNRLILDMRNKPLVVHYLFLACLTYVIIVACIRECLKCWINSV